MKILQVAHTFPPYSYGGAEKYTYQLSHALAAKHEVHVFYPFVGLPYLSVHNRREGKLHLHEISLGASGSSWRRMLRALKFRNSFQNEAMDKAFGHLLNVVQPDVIHFQHLLNLSVGMLKVARDFGVATVMTLHDYWYLCPTVQLYRYSDEVCSGPDAPVCEVCWSRQRTEAVAVKVGDTAARLAEHVLRLNTLSASFAERSASILEALNRVDLLIAPSSFLRNTYIQFGVESNKIIHSANGYNVTIFTETNGERCSVSSELASNGLTFGFVGRVTPLKGVHTLVEAFSRIPEDSAQLVIYGGYDSHSNYFRSLERLRDGNSNIYFKGRTDDLQLAYEEIDVLVFPSLWYENCPLVLLERQITRTPVIASDIGAIPEFVNHGHDGYLFEPGNTDELFNRILECIRHPELVSALSSNIEAMPTSIEQQASEIERLYEQIS